MNAIMHVHKRTSINYSSSGGRARAGAGGRGEMLCAIAWTEERTDRPPKFHPHRWEIYHEMTMVSE